MNALFLATDLGSISFSGSFSTGGEPEKLLDYRLDTFWLSNSRFDQSLTVTRPVGAINAVAVVGTNFDVLAELVRFEGATDAAFVTSSVLATFSGTAEAQVLTFPAVSFPYWRLNFRGPESFPRIAQVYVGTAVEVESYLPPFEVENVEASTMEGVPLTGRIRTAKIYDPRVAMAVRFDYLSEATRSAFIDLVNTTRGKTRPFFFRNHEGVTRFVRFVEDYSPVDIRGFNLNATQVVRMRTQETSGFWNLQGPNAVPIEVPDIVRIPDSKYVTSVS